MAYKTGNPVLSKDTFDKLFAGEEKMTLDGTVNKTALMLLVVVIMGAVGWAYYSILAPFVLPLVIGAFILALILAFKPSAAPFLAPLYALGMGVAVGVISKMYNDAYSGIVLQALGLTLAIAGVMLFLYKTRIIKATENFKLAVTSATLGIAVFYMASILGQATGWFQLPLINDIGLFGILFSLFVVGIAALNLVMDFDFIEHGVEKGAPKYMEWYGAFGLTVTLIWLYLELLRLLSKLARR